jgi:hypothetical protein
MAFGNLRHSLSDVRLTYQHLAIIYTHRVGMYHCVNNGALNFVPKTIFASVEIACKYHTTYNCRRIQREWISSFDLSLDTVDNIGNNSVALALPISRRGRLVIVESIRRRRKRIIRRVNKRSDISYSGKYVGACSTRGLGTKIGIHGGVRCEGHQDKPMLK